jgi:hypothetical protein
MLLQRVHVCVAGEGKKYPHVGMSVGRCRCKYVELAVTDGLNFWNLAGRHQTLTL